MRVFENIPYGPSTIDMQSEYVPCNDPPKNTRESNSEVTNMCLPESHEVSVVSMKLPP